MEKIEILFEDEHLLIVNKPPGISVIPERDISAPSLQKLLEKTYQKLFVVHRIDKETSGVLCFAKNETAHKYLNIQFEEHRCQKYYYAIVHGRPEIASGEIHLPIAQHPFKKNKMIVHVNGKESLTYYKIEESFRHASLLYLQIKTGRTHQIRVHLSSIGNPLLVDSLYGNTSAFYLSSIKPNYKLNVKNNSSGFIEKNENPIISRLTLHASELRCLHPVSEKEIIAKAPLAQDINLLLKMLRKYDLQ